jgi:hypothetical protein
MVERKYVVTAEIFSREEDGTSQEDGSRVYKSYLSRETWSFPETATLGEIMKAVDDASGYAHSVTITPDRYSHKLHLEERHAALKARDRN